MSTRGFHKICTKKTPHELGKTSYKIKVFDLYSTILYVYYHYYTPSSHNSYYRSIYSETRQFLFHFLTIRLFFCNFLHNFLFLQIHCLSHVKRRGISSSMRTGHRLQLKEEWLALSFYLIIIITLVYPANHFHRILYLILILRFLNELFNDTIRLNTGAPGALSLQSTQKYPFLTNWKLSNAFCIFQARLHIAFPEYGE